MSSSSKFKTDMDQLDELVKDLLNEVNRPISHNNHHQYSYQRYANNDTSNGRRYDYDSSSGNVQRSRTTREERTRVKRGYGETDIPIIKSSSMTTTTTRTTKPQIEASIDEHLIDSLLESVQNTLRKRAQRNQSNWSRDIPIHHRRTYSSSANCHDSIDRMDSMRGRHPLRVNQMDSPTSSMSSRRVYNRHDSRAGGISASTSVIPTHFRATSEPPPDGPIELRRMDLIHSPSRVFVESHAPPQQSYHYSRSTLPSRGIRVRANDHLGYETDSGLMTSRTCGPRYYRPPPPPPPPAPTYYWQRQYEGHRPMCRSDGYDTDSGLISSGRLRMSRTLPPRMAVIPETVVVNNRVVSSTNLNTLPSNLRSSSFLNQASRSENFSGYETDSGMNIRQHTNGFRNIPVDIRHGDNKWAHSQTVANSHRENFNDTNQRYRQNQEQTHATTVPVYNYQADQHKMTTQISSSVSANDSHKKSITVLPTVFPGSVGLSNPINNNAAQQNQQQQHKNEIEIKCKIVNDDLNKRLARPHGGIIDNNSLSSSIDNGSTKQQIFSTRTEIIPNVSRDNEPRKNSTSTHPFINQSYNAHVKTRVENSSYQANDEISRRSSTTSTTESDASRNGVVQAHNVSQFWYKEKLSRDDAIKILKTKPPGAFIVRDSQGFPGSFGLAVKVETLPAGIQSKPGADPNAELVRHYLIERTPTGYVRLKGCPNEPEFPNLSSLVYQHTITPMALPIRLVLPTKDISEDYHSIINQQQDTKKTTIKDLLEKGAACNVIYLNNVDVESLSGSMAVSKALQLTFENPEQLQATIVHFKVSSTGITLTDTKKKIFSRRHFPKEYVTYCGVDYETDRFWTYQFNDLEMLPRAKCFGFVSKKINGANSSQPENECHIFAEVEASQPSTAIVNFVSKVMIGSVPV